MNEKRKTVVADGNGVIHTPLEIEEGNTPGTSSRVRCVSLPKLSGLQMILGDAAVYERKLTKRGICV